MHQRGGEPDQARVAVEVGGLDGGDLMLAKAFANQIKTRGQRGVAKAFFRATGDRRGQGGNQGFFRIGELALRFRQRSCERADFGAGALHGTCSSSSPGRG
jgi:hypothetical protein